MEDSDAQKHCVLSIDRRHGCAEVRLLNQFLLVTMEEVDCCSNSEVAFLSIVDCCYLEFQGSLSDAVAPALHNMMSRTIQKRQWLSQQRNNRNVSLPSFSGSLSSLWLDSVNI